MESRGRDAAKVGVHPNRLLTLIVAGMVLVSLFVAVVTAEKSPKKFSLKTPQGVVQSYLRAILDGQPESASRYLSSKSECRVGDIERSYITSTSRIALINSRTYKNSAQVEVSVQLSDGDLSLNSYQEEHMFRLIKENGNWMLIGEPWPLYGCGSVQK